MFDASLVLLTLHFAPIFNPIQFLVLSLAGTTGINYYNLTIVFFFPPFSFFIINFGYFI